MPATYAEVDEATRDLVHEVMEAHHEPLCVEGVKLDLVFAYAPVDEETGIKVGDALKHRGVRALAIARVVKLKDRAKGMGDGEIEIDGDDWQEYSRAERIALIDHELHHFVLDRDRKDEVKRDDLGRPRLKIRQHDFDIGGFYEVVARNPTHAFEGRAVIRVAGEMTQLELPFEDDERDESFNASQAAFKGEVAAALQPLIDSGYVFTAGAAE